MRETLTAMVQGVTVHQGEKPKLVANNTVRYIRRDGAEVIRLHHTDIVTRFAGGIFELSTGGWRTVTTKERLNRYSPARVHSAKSQWYIGAVPYFDGIRVDNDGAVLNAPVGAEDAANMRQLAKDINAFCKKLDTLAGLPVPSAGDCWICMFQREPGNGRLEFNSNTAQTGHCEDAEHLRQHIAEGYIHGALLLNALTWAGYRDPGLIFAMDNSDMKCGRKPASTKRALRRYLRRKLGLG